MKKWIIIFVVILMFLLSSCYYIWPVYPEEEEMSSQEDTRQFVEIYSSKLFVYKNTAMIACRVLLPAEIMNPNDYAITISVDGVDLILAENKTVVLEKK